MRQFGLIGYPLSHSFSKKYFSEKFEKERITDANYDLYPISDISELPELFENKRDLIGLNVTIPYKEQVLTYVDELSDVVATIGACNCIYLKDGKKIGHNTDVIGFEKSLLKKLNSTHKKALVLGTGGAAKAVHYILNKHGIDFKEVSRNPISNNLSYKDIDQKIIEDHTLIINTTPLGMYPNVESAPDIPYEFINESHYLFDLVYNPEHTIFLQMGLKKGAAIENGSDMLVDQAEASWDIWNEKII